MITATTDRPAANVQEPGRSAGRIGPNAVLQLIEALQAAGLEQAMAPIFSAAGAGAWLAEPPQSMVDAQLAGRLHRAVRASLPPAQASAVMQDAGTRTAIYLLSARIPRAAQIVLKCLPARPASALLVTAIRAHAYTFGGDGHFSATAGKPTVFELSANPLCAGERASAPVCIWHAAVFAQLFRTLVSPAATCIETSCAACGDEICRFVLRWDRSRTGPLSRQ